MTSHSPKITEDAIEMMAIERLEVEGYSYRHGPDIARVKGISTMKEPKHE
jgi:hypothetical protein